MYIRNYSELFWLSLWSKQKSKGITNKCPLWFSTCLFYLICGTLGFMRYFVMQNDYKIKNIQVWLSTGQKVIQWMWTVILNLLSYCLIFEIHNILFFIRHHLIQTIGLLCALQSPGLLDGQTGVVSSHRQESKLYIGLQHKIRKAFMWDCFQNDVSMSTKSINS